MKQNKGVRIVATLALLAIVLSIVGTGILLIFSTNSTPTINTELTPEQKIELEKLINSQSGSISTLSGSLSLPDISASGAIQ